MRSTIAIGILLVPLSPVVIALDQAPAFAVDAATPAVLAGLVIDWGIGYRRFELSWETAASTGGSAPIAPFTAQWKHIEVAESGVDLSYTTGPLRVRGNLNHGTVVDWSSHLSGYADDSRQQQTYRSENTSDDGDRWEGTIALGLVCEAPWGLRLIPEMGYTWSRQGLSLTDGDQVVPATGPYPGLDSSYEATWESFFVALEGAMPIGGGFEVMGRAAYRRSDYTGIADWNLRTDLEHPDSVVQNAQGDGASMTLRLSYRFINHLCGWVGGDLEWWRADSGTSRTNYASGIRDETTLNQVRSGSRAARAGLRWEF